MTDSPQTPSDLVIIKRYPNRKLYDTSRSCYVTLEDIAEMVRGGEDVHVVDNKTGEDLTAVTFAQVIFEIEKKEKKTSLVVLKQLIQSGSEKMTGFFSEKVSPTFEKIQAEWEKSIVGKALHRTDPTQEDQQAQNKEANNMIQTLIKNSQKLFDDLQKKIDERIKEVSTQVAHYAHLGQEINTLKTRIDTLEQKIDKLLQVQQEVSLSKVKKS